MVADTDVAANIEAPPRNTVGPIAWIRTNLLSSWSNTLLTVIGLYLAYEAASSLIYWGVVSATFTGADGSVCTREGAGACWPFITAKFAQFMYGRYPEPERWRVNLVYVLALAGLVPLMIPRVPGKFWNAIYVFVIFPVIAYMLLVGGVFGLLPIDTALWGGLLVTLVVATVGIAGSFPLGILLALGRRSKMPIVRWVSVGFIEFVRGVPLITVLFMASVMLPLILPQALKLVIPGIVNTFIGLFKDTSLVLIIGLFDLLGIVQLNNADSKWFSPTTAMTGYVFAGFVFWIFCFGMSRYSQLIERRLAAGERR